MEKVTTLQLPVSEMIWAGALADASTTSKSPGDQDSPGAQAPCSPAQTPQRIKEKSPVTALAQ